MFSADQLRRLPCTPRRAPAMDAAEIASQLEALPEWRLEQGALRRSYAFVDFHRTMAFVNAVAWIAHAQDHHPDLGVHYGRCDVAFSTHSAGGVTLNDFACAARVDALLAQGPDA